MVTKATRDVIDLNVRSINDGLRVDGDNSANFTIDGTTIGGTTPGAGTFIDLTATNLTVTGTIDGTGATVVGTWEATYGDIAENYEADEDYARGTIVKIGGEKEITLPEDSMDDVFGVISSNPAYVLNSGKEGLYLPVVLTGRAPVRVHGPVSKGDRLVLSQWQGVARRALETEQNCRCFGRVLVADDADGERLVEVAFGSI